MLPVNFAVLRYGMLGMLMMSAFGCSSIRVETQTTYLARQDALLQMQESTPAAGYESRPTKGNKKENNLR